MTEWHNFGFNCKNEKCGKAVVIGKYTVAGKDAAGEDLVTLLKVNPRNTRCPFCGNSYNYVRKDIVDFG